MPDIRLIGTGALRPLPERALASAVLTCEGRSILFDCGEGTQTRLRGEGVSLVRIDVIALTHYHGDHIYGLPGLWHSMGIDGRTAPLYILGPEGIEKELAPVLTLCGGLPFELRLATLTDKVVRLREICEGWPHEAVLTAFPTRHRVPSCGYRFDLMRAGRFMPEAARELGVPQKDWGRLQRGESVTVGKREVRPEEVLGEQRRGIAIAYSGDTLPCESLTRAAQGVDLLICEATYGEDEQASQALEHGHMTYRQAAATARDADVGELWLTHFSPRIKETEEFLPNAQAVFENSVCGADGMVRTISFEKR